MCGDGHSATGGRQRAPPAAAGLAPRRAGGAARRRRSAGTPTAAACPRLRPRRPPCWRPRARASRAWQPPSLQLSGQRPWPRLRQPWRLCQRQPVSYAPPRPPLARRRPRARRPHSRPRPPRPPCRACARAAPAAQLWRRARPRPRRRRQPAPVSAPVSSTPCARGGTERSAGAWRARAAAPAQPPGRRPRAPSPADAWQPHTRALEPPGAHLSIVVLVALLRERHPAAPQPSRCTPTKQWTSESNTTKE